MSREDYDVAIVGAGPGGYVAAIRASQLGMRTVLVNEYARAGGTCLNVGCIPSKALLHSTMLYERTVSGLSSHGISTGEVSFSLSKMQERKDGIVDTLGKGIAFLLSKNGITYIEGFARLRKDVKSSGDGCLLSVASSGKNGLSGKKGSSKRKPEQEIRAHNIILALGSKPHLLPSAIAEVDEKIVLTSTGALALTEVPRHLAVIGAGVIGLELGSVWARLGSEVTVIDTLDCIGGLDADLSREFQKILEKTGRNSSKDEKLGMKFRLQTGLVSLKRTKAGLAITTRKQSTTAGGSTNGGSAGTGESSSEDTWHASHALLAIGRKAASTDIDLESAGVECDARGFIEVDGSFRTSVAGVYAIGDCIGGAMLAHKAEGEGVALVESLAVDGDTSAKDDALSLVDYSTIAGVIYTHPEVAVVGVSEREARARGISYDLGKFPFSANSRARASGTATGLVKLLVDSSDHRLIGAQILGDEAGTLIQELIAIMAYRGTVEDIAHICHPHPSLNEALREAALAALGRALHI